MIYPDFYFQLEKAISCICLSPKQDKNDDITGVMSSIQIQVSGVPTAESSID